MSEYDWLIVALREYAEKQREQLVYEAADAIEELSKRVEGLEAAQEISPEAQHFVDTKADRIIDGLQDLLACVKGRSWISVKEALPEGEVLAVNALKGTYGYHEYLIGYIYENCESNSGFICENESEVLMNVTHWMPLPEPPKEEE